MSCSDLEMKELRRRDGIGIDVCTHDRQKPYLDATSCVLLIRFLSSLDQNQGNMTRFGLRV